MGNPLLFQLNMLTFNPQGECLSLPRFFGGFGLHGSTMDLCNLRGYNTLQSSWNLLRNQSWADMSVSNGWNSPLLGFGGGMSYMDTFSYQGPNIPLLLGNACYQANMYSSGGPLGAACAVGGAFGGALAPGLFGPTPGVVTPGSNGPSDLTPEEENAKRYYENLKSLLNSYKALSDSLSSEDTAIEAAIKTADAKTTYAEKLRALEISFATYKDSILSKIRSGDITISGVDLSELGIISNTNLRSNLSELNELIEAAKDSSGDSKDANIKSIEDLLADTSAFPILDVISNYNAQYSGSNIFDISDNKIIKVFADKLLAKAAEIEKDAQSLLSNESLQSFKEAIEDLGSSKIRDNLKELYIQSRLILAMLEDRKFVDNYGTAMGNKPLTTMVLKQLRDELNDDDLANPIKMKDETITGAEEVSGAEDAGNEDGNNDDNTPENRDYSRKNKEKAKELLRCSFYSKVTNYSSDDGSILIKYNNKTADNGDDDKYYLIKDNKIYESNASGNVSQGAKSVESKNMPAMKEFDAMVDSLDNLDNFAELVNDNESLKGTDLYKYCAGEWHCNKVGDPGCGRESAIDGMADDIGGIVDQLAKNFKSLGFSDSDVDAVADEIKAFYESLEPSLKGKARKGGEGKLELSVDIEGENYTVNQYRKDYDNVGMSDSERTSISKKMRNDDVGVFVVTDTYSCDEHTVNIVGMVLVNKFIEKLKERLNA